MANLVGIEPYIKTRPRKGPQGHDSLHSAEWCWCKCPQCWYEWKTTNPKTGERKLVGLCICLDCHCPSNGAVYIRPSLSLGKVA